ncbi:MAG: hypothetical protein ACC652_09475, partial [Acidimicrobiales bacterium]
MSRSAGTERPISHLGPKKHFSLLRALYRVPFPLRSAATPKGAGPNPYTKGIGADYDTDWARKLPARFARLAVTSLVWQPLVTFY